MRIGWRPLDRPLVGLSISEVAVRSVLVHQGRITRTWSSPLCGHSSLEEALLAVLTDIPRRWRQKPRVFVTVGLRASRIRRLARLPQVDDARTIAAVVRAGGARFFSHADAVLISSGICRGKNGDVWAVAFDERVVTATVRACQERGFNLAMMLPAPVALHAVYGVRMISWEEDGILLRSHFEPSGTPTLVSYRAARFDRNEISTDISAPVAQPLALLGAQGVTMRWPTAQCTRGEADC